MRPNLLPALGVVLSLRTIGAFASITCDPKHNPRNNSTDMYIPSAAFLAEVANNCITEVCTAGGSAGSITKDCGPILLTISSLGAPLSNQRDCIKEFRNIVDQCITTEGAYGGILQTHNVLYDIAAVDQHEGKEGVEEVGIQSDEEDSDDEEEEDEGEDDHDNKEEEDVEEDDDFLQKRRQLVRRKGRKSKSKTKLTTQRKAKTPRS
jgi:hypothetical protein